VHALVLLGTQLSTNLRAAAAQVSAHTAAATMAFRTNPSRVLANPLDLQMTMELVGGLAVRDLADRTRVLVDRGYVSARTEELR